MSRHVWSIVVDVDDEALAAHDGEQAAPPNDVDEWDASDLFAAAHLGIVDFSEASFEGDLLAATHLGKKGTP